MNQKGLRREKEEETDERERRRNRRQREEEETDEREETDESKSEEKDTHTLVVCCLTRVEERPTFFTVSFRLFFLLDPSGSSIILITLAWSATLIGAIEMFLTALNSPQLLRCSFSRRKKVPNESSKDLQRSKDRHHEVSVCNSNLGK